MSRQAILLALLKVCVLFAALTWLQPRRTTHPGYSLAFAGVMLLYFMWPVFRAFATGIAVTITQRGITSYVGGVEFVAWEEIQGARASSFWGTSRVELDLRNQDAVLARVKGIRGWSLRVSVKRYGIKPGIAASFVEGGPEAVLGAIGERVAIPSGAG